MSEKVVTKGLPAGGGLRLGENVKSDLHYYEKLLGNGSELIVILDKNGKLKYNSSNITEILGYTKTQIIGSNVFEFIHHDDYKDIIEVFKRGKLSPKTPQSVFFRIKHRDDSWRYFRSKGMNLLTDPKIQGILVNSIDITAQVHAEEDLKKSEARFSLIAKESREGIWEWEISTDRLFWSERIKNLFGIKKESELASLGQFKNLIFQKDREHFVNSLWNHIHKGSPFEVEFRIRNQQKDYRYFQIRGGVQRDELGMPLYMAGFISDITREKKLKLKDKYLKSHDGSTRLPNRTLLLEKIADVIGLCEAEKLAGFSLAVLTIDNLKNIETLQGPNFRTELVSAFVTRIKQTLKKAFVLARMAENEFALVFEGLTGIEAKAKCESLHSIFGTPFEILGRQVYLNTHFGVTEYEPETLSETLLRNASIALYRSKNRGQLSCELFVKEMHNDAVYLHQLEMDLREALDKSQFELFYQPIASLHTEKVTGFEALIRWNHPKWGVMYPTDFIWLAEETGVILPIGDWVLETACKQVKLWKKKFKTPLKISINFSARQFKNENILATIHSIVKNHSIDPSDIQIEITETVAMDDTALNKKTLESLEEMGIYVSIDDFGIGYSSLEMLKKFDLHTLKIDRSFIQGLGNNVKDSKIVSSIISMARTLDLRIVAEGVENSKQLEFLRENNCDEIQGFYLSRPMDVVKAEAFLQHHNKIPLAN